MITRSDKDEIARLKAENVALQQRLFSAAESISKPTPQPSKAADPRDAEIASLKSDLAKVRQDFDAFKKASLDEIKLLTEQSIAAADYLAIVEEKTEIAESLVAQNEILQADGQAKDKIIADLSAKIECINSLKIRNTFLESENALLSERALTAEALVR